MHHFLTISELSLKGTGVSLKCVANASDNTPIDLDDCKVLTAFDNTLTGNVILLDTNRYIVNDDYGVFLCTYDKGETEEEVIMQF